MPAQAKEKSEPASVEHNYLDPPDSVPLHSGNDASGNSGNDDYHSGGGNGNGNGGNEHGNGNVNGNGIGNGNANGKGDHRRQGKKNGNGNGNGNGRQGADFEDPVIFVDQMETTEFVHRISITEPTTTMATTMATTTTTQPPSK